jgi:hypothetical protein
MSKRVPLDRLRAISRKRPLATQAKPQLVAEWPIEGELKKAER